MKAKRPLMSVIVPVYNGEAVIGQCLEAVRSQEGFAPGEIELIVVDDASTDKSAEAAKGLCDRLIEMDVNAGAAAARNRGAEDAKGEVLVFVDADVYLEPGALRAMADALVADKELTAAVGRYTELPATPGFIALYHNAFTRYHHDLSPQEIDWFWGALGAVRKEDFDAVGGFDERYQGASAEDMELGLALSRAGYRIVYLPGAEGRHAHEFTLGGMLVNDYKKAVLGTKLRLKGRLPRRAPGFANARNLAAIFCLMMILVIPLLGLPFSIGVFGVLFFPGFFIAGRPFYNYLWKLRGPGTPALAAVALHAAQMLAIAAGAAAGVIGWMTGRDTFGRPGWI